MSEHFVTSFLPASRDCCTTWRLAHRDLHYRPSSLLVCPRHSRRLLRPPSPLPESDTPPPSFAPLGHTAPNTEGQSGRSCWGLLLSTQYMFFFLPLCARVLLTVLDQLVKYQLVTHGPMLHSSLPCGRALELHSWSFRMLP